MSGLVASAFTHRVILKAGLLFLGSKKIFPAFRIVSGWTMGMTGTVRASGQACADPNCLHPHESLPSPDQPLSRGVI